MRARRLLILTALAATLAIGAAAPASADPIVGVGEQYPEMFTDTKFQALGVRTARLLVGWDALHYRWQRAEIDLWMAESRRAGVEAVVSFGRSRNTRHKRKLPTATRFRIEFRAFRARYPHVKTFIPWNEANHCSQPTCHRPDMAARYFDVIKSECAHCPTVAADVLDQPNMIPWVRAFKRHVQHHPRVWGLHNYLDANRFRTTGTRRLLNAVHGDIWFTETGGLVKRKNNSRVKFPDSSRHAAKATRWVFKLAGMSSRIKRVYFYHWAPAPKPSAPWDSALIGRDGRARPAYNVLRSWVRASQARKAQAAGH